MTKNIAYFLPRNTDEMELRQAAGPGEVFEVEENYINKSIKAITVYYGDLVCNAEESQYEPPPPSDPMAEMHWEQGGPATDGAEEPAAAYAPTTEQLQVAGAMAAENGEEKGEGGREPPPAPPPLASPGTVRAGEDGGSDHQSGQSVLSPTPTKQ